MVTGSPDYNKRRDPDENLLNFRFFYLEVKKN